MLEQELDTLEAATVATMQATAAQTRAEAKLIAAKAAFFELGGWGGVIAASGLALWLGSLAVVKYQGENAKTQEAERAFIERVAATPLKVEGVLKLADDQQVRLAPGAQLTLAKGGMVGVSPDATVGLDPNATLRIAGEAPPAPRPAPIQANAKAASGAPVVKIDVDQFRTVSYGGKDKDVVTGWRFGNSAEDKPVEQWCHYRELEPDGTFRLLKIAEDGQRIRLPTPSPFPKVDLEGAFASCVWWSASRTPASPRSPSGKPDGPAAPSSPRVISARVKG